MPGKAARAPKFKEAHVAATFLIGRAVAKEFKGMGTFNGRVTDFHRDTGFRVEYEDGDTEDLTESALLKILIGGTSEPSAPAFEAQSSLAKRSAPPAVTLDEYVASARRSARRKRKHTELKRSGVLERKRQEVKAAREAALAATSARQPLHPPPSWAEGMDREGRAVRCDGLVDTAHLAPELDMTLFRLSLTPIGRKGVSLRWWFPPANPGDSGAWIGLFRADAVVWGANGSPHGEVESGDAKVLYKLITRNDSSGTMNFNNLASTGNHGQPIKDDVYVFTLQQDYGRFCRATSERFEVRGGQIVQVFEGALSCDWPSVNRKARQASASLLLVESVKRSKDVESEVLDERCYFPVTAVDMTLPERYQEGVPFLKRTYAIVDKASFLDWGLTSDYLVGGGEEEGDGGRGLRARQTSDKGGSTNHSSSSSALINSTQYSALPSFAQHASRKVADRGMGGGTLGSEGYGEATIGSAHKIGTLLTHLRQLVLHDLYDTHWGLMWDLGPHSTFLDIGSGYGKVVLHLRLLARMRRAVGLECVTSRDQIAKQALFSLEAESGNKWGAEEGAAEAAMAASQRPSPSTVVPEGGDGSCSNNGDGEMAADVAKGDGSSGKAMKGSTDANGDEGRQGGGKSGAKEGGQPGGNAGGKGGSEEGNSDTVSLPRTVRSGPFDGIEFICGDATATGALSYTHIYIFDWVFSKSTLRELAQVLQESPFYVLCSFRHVKEWWGNGLVKIQPVAKLTGFRTTGGEGMTCFVYINLEKVPAQ